MKITILFFVLNFMVAHLGHCQVSSDSLMRLYLYETKENIRQENYEQALMNIHKIFNLKIVLHEEVAYYYGYILVKQNEYRKARGVLMKFLDSSDESSPYYSQAKELLKEIEGGICGTCDNTGYYLTPDICSLCKGSGKSETPCRFCKSKGKGICSVCKGNGLIQQKGNIGNIYHTCSKCKGKGVAECDACNGETVISNVCQECKGDGSVIIKKKCLHKNK